MLARLPDYPLNLDDEGEADYLELPILVVVMANVIISIPSTTIIIITITTAIIITVIIPTIVTNVCLVMVVLLILIADSCVTSQAAAVIPRVYGLGFRVTKETITAVESMVQGLGFTAALT